MSKQRKSREIEACYVAFGARVRIMREALGITQQELADRLPSLDRTSIANIEGGRQRVLLHTVVEIAGAFGSNAKHMLKGIWW